jgi:hypothetical protein
VQHTLVHSQLHALFDDVQGCHDNVVGDGSDGTRGRGRNRVVPLPIGPKPIFGHFINAVVGGMCWNDTGKHSPHPTIHGTQRLFFKKRFHLLGGGMPVGLQMCFGPIDRVHAGVLHETRHGSSDHVMDEWTIFGVVFLPIFVKVFVGGLLLGGGQGSRYLVEVRREQWPQWLQGNLPGQGGGVQWTPGRMGKEQLKGSEGTGCGTGCRSRTFQLPMGRAGVRCWWAPVHCKGATGVEAGEGTGGAGTNSE